MDTNNKDSSPTNATTSKLPDSTNVSGVATFTCDKDFVPNLDKYITNIKNGTRGIFDTIQVLGDIKYIKKKEFREDPAAMAMFVQNISSAMITVFFYEEKVSFARTFLKVLQTTDAPLVFEGAGYDVKDIIKKTEKLLHKWEMFMRGHATMGAFITEDSLGNKEKYEKMVSEYGQMTIIPDTLHRNGHFRELAHLVHMGSIMNNMNSMFEAAKEACSSGSSDEKEPEKS